MNADIKTSSESVSQDVATNSSSNFIVKTEDLYKYFGSQETEVRAVDGVTISIPKRKFTVLTGPSGCGKTTLMNMFGTIDTPTSGKITVADTNILNLNDQELAHFRAEHIGFIFQSYNLIPVMNVFDNVAYPLLLARTPRMQVKDKVKAILTAVEIDHLSHKKPIHLSGGQQQRVSIARALVNNPSLILADEPTANLDSKTALLILELMQHLATTENCTFIFSTHHDLVVEYANLVFKMKDGKIIDQITKH